MKNRFLPAATVVLSGLAGLLIALPFIRLEQNTPNMFDFGILLALTILGALAGYRRRASRAFFYLSLITVLVLTTTLSRQLVWL